MRRFLWRKPHDGLDPGEPKPQNLPVVVQVDNLDGVDLRLPARQAGIGRGPGVLSGE